MKAMERSPSYRIQGTNENEQVKLERSKRTEMRDGRWKTDRTEEGRMKKK